MVDIREFFKALLLKSGVPSASLQKKLAEYLKACGDLPLRAIALTVKEKGLLEPEELRKHALKTATLLAIEELFEVLDRFIPGMGAVRFSDPRLAGFVSKVGGLEEVARMSPKEIRQLLLYYYEQLPTDKDLVLSLTTHLTDSYILLDMKERKLKRFRNVEDFRRALSETSAKRLPTRFAGGEK